MRFGAHVSVAKGMPLAFGRGREAGCECIQIFTSYNTRWGARPLGEEEVAQFREGAREWGQPIFSHASYLINLASPDDSLWERSMGALADDLARCELLGIPYLILHPGSHKGEGEAFGLARIAEAIRQVFARAANEQVMLLLENTAGQGATLGGRFEHLGEILSAVAQPERLGLCIDTCHAFAAGYPWQPKPRYEKTVAEMDRAFGLGKIRAFHLNDSKGERGSHLDRHAEIGEGKIGLAAFGHLANDARFAETPGLLELPPDLVAPNVARLRKLRR